MSSEYSDGVYYGIRHIKTACAEQSSRIVRQYSISVMVLPCLVATLLFVGGRAEAQQCPSPLGDVTGDGKINAVDVNCAVLTSIWQYTTPWAPAPKCLAKGEPNPADIQCDGSVSLTDVMLVVLAAKGENLALLLDPTGDGCPNACQADTDGDGNVDPEDCAPFDANKYVGAAEHCNNKDDNCDGLIDEGDVCEIDDDCVKKNGCNCPNVSCEDGIGCTLDLCVGGICVHVPNNGWCETDSVFCTVQTCDAKKGCVFSLDHNKCDDGNDCTLDQCDAKSGCISSPMPTGTSCDASDFCSAECNKGAVCVEKKTLDCDDDNPCTADLCSKAKGGCVYVPFPAACDDGNPCTVKDFCTNGACQGGVAISCNDTNPCTVDSCGPGGKCLHVPTVELCNDNNPCTADSCDSKVGCVYSVLSAPCDDGNFCTTNDTCTAGKCKGTAAKICDDGNVCTTDYCDALKGCFYTNNQKSCDDGDPFCTMDDTCDEGQCVGLPMVCDDGNQCTDDECAAGIGCDYHNNSQCNDGKNVPPGAVCTIAGEAGTTVVCPLRMVKEWEGAPGVASFQLVLTTTAESGCIAGLQDTVCLKSGPCESSPVPPYALYPSGHEVISFPSFLTCPSKVQIQVIGYDTPLSTAFLSLDPFMTFNPVVGSPTIVEVLVMLKTTIPADSPTYLMATNTSAASMAAQGLDTYVKDQMIITSD